MYVQVAEDFLKARRPIAKFREPWWRFVCFCRHFQLALFNFTTLQSFPCYFCTVLKSSKTADCLSGLCSCFNDFLCMNAVRHQTKASLICLNGDRKGIQTVISLVLVCRWWRFDWSFARLIAPVDTSVTFVTKIKTRTIIIGRRFQRTRTRMIVIQKTKMK